MDFKNQITDNDVKIDDQEIEDIKIISHRPKSYEEIQDAILDPKGVFKYI